MLFHETLEQSTQRQPAAEALISGGQRYRYEQVQFMVDRIAALLQQYGVRHGERVAVFLHNGVEAVVSAYAAMKAGGVFMPISPLTRRDKLQYILSDSSPTVVITDARALEEHRDLFLDHPGVRMCVVCGDRECASESEAVVSFSRAILGPVHAPAPLARIDQDLAAIIYTSGSTGDPKGVMLSHLNILSASASIISYLGLTPEDNILCVLPLSFDYGLYQILMAFRVGARVTLERSFAFPVPILEAMAFERVTVLPGVPTLFTILTGLRVLAHYDLSALRIVTNTGAALSRRHIADIRHAFPQARLFSMYGLTECKRVSYLPPEELDRRPDSIGRGMPNQEAYLVDEEGRRLPPGATGELVIRGSHVMKGYWRKPAATEACLRPGPDGERVLYTGDIFRSDAEGYLYFVGRRDDMIKSRGEKVSPKEVEGVLYGLEGVAEAAVIGVPDPLLGTAVQAVVALRAGFHYTERDIIRHCVCHLENHMVPKYVSFMTALPKTSTGKIAKQELARAYQEFETVVPESTNKNGSEMEKELTDHASG